MRDVSDRPILRAAIAAKADILLTGDKDFLESGITNSKIMTPTEFLHNEKLSLDKYYQSLYDSLWEK